MAQLGLDQLARAVKRLSLRIDALERENAVLQDHLERSGMLTKESLSACVHRECFAVTRRAHPCTLEATLADVLANEALAAAIAQCAGMPEVRKLCMPRCSTEHGRPEAAGRAAAAKRQGETSNTAPEVKQPPLKFGDQGLAMIYIFGGNDDAKTLNSCERFNPVANTWESLPPITQARSAAAAAVVGDRIYVCGGNHCGQTLSHVEAFDVVNHVWHPVAPLFKSRSAAGAAELQGRLYVCGGWSGKQALASCERLDPATGQWEALAQMGHRREWPMVTADNDQLYLCGGQDGSEDVSVVELYDPIAQAWETLAMSLQCRRNAAIVVVSGLLYLCGGHGHDGRHVLNAVERFDPARCEWETLAPMQTHRRNAMATMVAGRIYVCGGRGSRGNHNHGGGHALRTAERFDPNTGTWEAVTPMASRRYRAAAVTVPM
mmetsp:Transcript_12890/g.40496  ORF Transcript_12890/g.40496 Transcript_12890/m.40496 type:complete len:434 (-) Transcript_12890:196-1497(-)